MGVVKTIELTVLGMVIGIVLGVVLARDAALTELPDPRRELGLHLVRSAAPRCSCRSCFFNFIAALYPTIDLGIPFGPSFIHLNANDVITPFVAGMLALGLNEGAYMSEIVRAGIISVDEGQTEAAKALGMTRGQTMRRHRPAAGDAGDHPADRQRDDLDAEEQLAGLRHRASTSCSTRRS